MVSGYINDLDKNIQALFFDNYEKIEVNNGEVTIV
jgi:hypothetical protein